MAAFSLLAVAVTLVVTMASPALAASQGYIVSMLPSHLRSAYAPVQVGETLYVIGYDENYDDGVFKFEQGDFTEVSSRTCAGIFSMNNSLFGICYTSDLQSHLYRLSGSNEVDFGTIGDYELTGQAAIFQGNAYFSGGAPNYDLYRFDGSSAPVVVAGGPYSARSFAQADGSLYVIGRAVASDLTLDLFEFDGSSFTAITTGQIVWGLIPDDERVLFSQLADPSDMGSSDLYSVGPSSPLTRVTTDPAMPSWTFASFMGSTYIARGDRLAVIGDSSISEPVLNTSSALGAVADVSRFDNQLVIYASSLWLSDGESAEPILGTEFTPRPLATVGDTLLVISDIYSSYGSYVWAITKDVEVLANTGVNVALLASASLYLVAIGATVLVIRRRSGAGKRTTRA
jgi:hypothetical protein